MAKYRQVHTKIWKDTWFCELSAMHKLFFIYLFTNEMASISGLYELSKRVMSFESGLSFGEIDSAFEEFTRAKKAYYQEGVVMVPSLRKYHETQSPKVQTAIVNDYRAVRDCELKGMYYELYGIDRVYDTLSIPRYSSSISSSDSSSSNGSSNGKPQPTMHNTENIPDAVHGIITALTAVSKTPYWVQTENDYHDAAHTLHNLGATPEQVQGFGQWWKDCGHYIGKPALKSIMADWVNYADGVKPGVKADEVVTFVVFDD